MAIQKLHEQQQQALCQRMGYQFADAKLLLQALTHRSYDQNNNERLEFLGDAVLSCIIAQALYERFPHAQEGQLSRLRAYLVRGTMLAQVAKSLNLGEALLLGPGELKSGGHHRKSILENALEALIGAVYLDGGLDTCKEQVVKWYGDRLQKLSLTDNVRDAKSYLQEWAQAQGYSIPKYQILKVEGAEHCQIFHVNCTVSEIGQIAEASGSSRKTAEQAAAAKVVAALGIDGVNS